MATGKGSPSGLSMTKHSTKGGPSILASPMPTITRAKSNETSEIDTIPVLLQSPMHQLLRWKMLLFQPWKWIDECWGDDGKDTDDEETKDDRENNDSFSSEEDGILPSHPCLDHGFPQNSGISYLATISPPPPPMKHQSPLRLPPGCPREVLVRPPMLHDNDRVCSFETNLTESDADYAFHHDDANDDDDDESCSLTSWNHLSKPVAHRAVSAPLRRPPTVSAHHAMFKSGRRNDNDNAGVNAVTEDRPLQLRARCDTSGTVATTNSRHRRLCVSVSPASLQALYKTKASYNVHDNEEKKNDDDDDESLVRTTRQHRDGHDLNDDCDDHGSQYKESQTTPNLWYLPASKDTCDTYASTTAEEMFVSWMDRWVGMSTPSSTASRKEHVVDQDTPVDTTKTQPATTIHDSPLSTAQCKQGYWCRDPTMALLVPKHDGNIVLEGWVTLKSNNKDNIDVSSFSKRHSSTSPAYLTLVDSSRCLYITTLHKDTIDAAGRNGATTEWDPFGRDHQQQRWSIQVSSSSNGHHRVVVRDTQSDTTVAWLTPVRRHGNPNYYHNDETAQHNAALHLCFALDAWRRTHVMKEVVSNPAHHWRSSSWASWEEEQVCAIEEERRRRLSDSIFRPCGEGNH